jgi:PAS domain S-box-containing protein
MKRALEPPQPGGSPSTSSTSAARRIGAPDPAWAAFGELVDRAPVIAFVKDETGRYVFMNARLLAFLGERLGDDWYGRTDDEIWTADAAARIRANDDVVRTTGTLQVFAQDLPHRDGTHDYLVVKFPIQSADGGNAYLGGLGIDLTERTRTDAERDRLAAVVEQVAESVVITDLEARITYVNPAFTKVSGFSKEETIGQNPRIVSSGVQRPAFYEAMWAALTSGQPWVADFVNRHKDGSLFEEEAVISPLRDAAGAITGYVAVKRDVTHERELVARSERIARERALIAETIRSLGARETPEQTASAICRQVVSLSGFVAAQIFLFELDGRAMPIGFVVEQGDDPPLRRLPLKRSAHLRERAAEGPWIEPWISRPWHPYNDVLNSMGVHLVGYAPLRADGELIGVLVVDGSDELDAAGLTDLLPSVVEFADLAAVLIGRDVADRTTAQRGVERIRSIIDSGRFHPVFQPIRDVDAGTIVGWEALTRFDDGVPPDVRFGEAASLGIGTDLEIAAIEAALRAAELLPPGPDLYLNLNVAPALVLAREPLRSLVAEVNRRIVLEVTEHSEIDDYTAFRNGVLALGPGIQLAIDDAGAGFASLRHILELRPAFVKLDRSLIAGIDSDSARRALVVGMGDFAASTGVRLIAEGVETEAELTTLRSIGVPLAQGYLLGRPTEADDPAVQRSRSA